METNNYWIAPALLAVTSIGLATYLVGLILYRIYLHPLARIPGPPAAAASFWYEFYWDVIQPGQLTHHLPDVHKKYGPIVRITPNEVHIMDSSFFDELYARSGTARRHKSPRMSGRFGFAEETFTAWHHDVHKMRRTAINPFFSAAKIVSFQPTIRKKLTKFAQALLRSHEVGETVSIDLGYTALIGDVMLEYAFARDYNHLGSPGFSVTYDQCLKAVFTLSNFNIHFPFTQKLFNALPRWITAAVNPVVLPVIDFYADSEREIAEIRTGLNEAHKLANNPTIFHELLLTDLLPEHEKVDKRLADEAVEIVAAGIVTTSWTLSIATFHILNNIEVLNKLRAELKRQIPDPLNLNDLQSHNSQVDWRTLEPLVYLSGCVKEAIRLSGGVLARSPRILPDQDLKYNDYIIPRRCEISMTTWHIANDASIFPDPTSFRPERWIHIDQTSGHSYKNKELERYLVAFGKGARQCAGMNLAYAELYLTLAVIFRTFDMELFETDESDVTNKHTYLVPYPKFDSKGVRLKVRGLLE